MQEKEFIIKESVLKAILEYLSHKPFREVAQAVQALGQLPEHEPKEEKKSE